MKKEEFIILAKKYSENKCTVEEKEVVEYFFDRLQLSEEIFLIPHEKGQQLLGKIQRGSYWPKVRGNGFVRALRIAAAFFITAGLSFAITLLVFKNAQITQTAAKGERKEVRLHDGSIVVLNSNSSITYPEVFDNTREIELAGEAYFKVYRDTAKPFTVVTRDVSVKVLGTSFNVNTNAHCNSKVSVISGKVEVKSPSGKTIVLTKNQQIGLNKGNNFDFSSNDSNEGIAWTKNIIFLKNTSLRETAKIIENWYNISVDFEDPALEKLTISGKFKEEKLETVLQSIAILKDLKIDYITKNHVLIRKDTKTI